MSLETDALEPMRQLRNQNRQWFLSSGEISCDEQVAWYNRYLATPNDYMFSILANITGRWCGVVAIYNVDALNASAEFGRLLISQKLAAVKGLGLDATIGVCQIASEQLGVGKMNLEVYADNIAAVKTYERAGFYIVENGVDPSQRPLLKMQKMLTK